ncbi:MAG: hypothetical protein KKG59_00915 [Nanoarchaeota archaeon]|nr:hypothetical protein [Nanoarchaeota archaeon]
MKYKEKISDAVLSVAIFVVMVSIVGIGLVLSDDPKSVTTQTNITSSLPIIDSIVINSGSYINLTEGSLKQIICNATIVNYNGKDDISHVNATFFRTNGTVQDGLYDAVNNNTGYQHVNCTYAFPGDDAFTFSYNCTMNLTYHAFNGSWNCTVFVNNSLNSPVNGTNSSWIVPLYAINVTDVMNFGELAVYDYSAVRSVNVTNWGNMPINLTIYGYGGEDNSTGYNRSFICPDGPGTNISLGYLRWELRDDNGWVNMTNITIGPARIDNVTIQKQTTDTNIWNTTYWKIYVPPNPFGACNGTIVYEAMLGGTN